MATEGFPSPFPPPLRDRQSTLVPRLPIPLPPRGMGREVHVPHGHLRRVYWQGVLCPTKKPRMRTWVMGEIETWHPWPRINSIFFRGTNCVHLPYSQIPSKRIRAESFLWGSRRQPIQYSTCEIGNCGPKGPLCFQKISLFYGPETERDIPTWKISKKM